MHGGLSPKLTRPEDVNSIKRPCKILAERNDLLSDLTWSDPHQKVKGEQCFVGADVRGIYALASERLGSVVRWHALRRQTRKIVCRPLPCCRAGRPG